MAINTADFILRVRFDYNDIDHDRVEDPLIIDYLNEGINALFQLNPQKFLKSVVAKMEGSDLQQPCCCDLLYSVDAITDANGNFIEDIKEVDDSAQSAFGKRNCPSRKSRSYSKIEPTDNQFTVNPPIGADEDLYARMTCAVKPEPIQEGDDIPDELMEHYAGLVDYVLYRLFGAETESTSSQQKSAQYYAQFQNRILTNEQIRTLFIKNEINPKNKKA